MKLRVPVILEMDSEQEPPEAALVTATYCPVCFAVVPGHRLADHQRAVHGSKVGT